MRATKLLPTLVAAVGLVAACGGSGAMTDTAATNPVSPTQAVSPQQEEQNKALVLSLYTEGFNQNKTDIVRNALAADFVQHGSAADEGGDGQVKLFDDLKAKIPGAVATVKHSAADGEYVAVHWQASATPDNENSGQAWADLYRVANGKIAEHWYVHQDTPATTASGNSLFSDAYQYPNGQPKLTEEQEEANKTLAVDAYGKLAAGDLNAIDQHWDPRYYQHNPLAANGTDAVKAFFAAIPRGSGQSFNVVHALADQDLVWVFLRAGNGVNADIFRVVDNKIIEHWDVLGGTFGAPPSDPSTPPAR